MKKLGYIFGFSAVAVAIIASLVLSLVFAQENRIVDDPAGYTYSVGDNGFPKLDGCYGVSTNKVADQTVRETIVVDGKKKHISGCKGAVMYYKDHVDVYKQYLNTKTQDYLLSEYNDYYVNKTKTPNFYVMSYDEYISHADNDGIIYENDFYAFKPDGTIEHVFTVPAYVDMDTLRQIYEDNKSFFTDEDYSFDDLFVM